MFLNQALTSAFQNNPDILLERGKVETAGLGVESEANVLNPFFLFDADTADKTYNFGLQKAFETGGLGKIRKKIQEKRKELQKARLQERVIALEEKVIKAFTQVYINQEKIKLLEETFKYIKKSREEIEDLPEEEELLTEVELLDIKQRLEDARIEIEKARLALEELLGEKVERDSRLGDPRNLDIKENMGKVELIQKALKENSKIIENESLLEIAQLQKNLAKADYWPLIIADAGAEIDFDEKSTGVFFGLDIELPVMGLEKKQVKIAEKRIEQVKENRKIIESEIRLKISENYELYKFTQKRLEEYDQEYLPKVEKLIVKIREKYSKNEISFKDLLKAEESKIEVQNNYFDALIDFKNAFSDLEKAVGISLAKDLAKFEIGELGSTGTSVPEYQLESDPYIKLQEAY